MSNTPPRMLFLVIVVVLFAVWQQHVCTAVVPAGAAHIRILHADLSLRNQSIELVIPEHLKPNDNATTSYSWQEQQENPLRERLQSNATFAKAGKYALINAATISNVSVRVYGLPHTYNVYLEDGEAFELRPNRYYSVVLSSLAQTKVLLDYHVQYDEELDHARIRPIFITPSTSDSRGQLHGVSDVCHHCLQPLLAYPGSGNDSFVARSSFALHISFALPNDTFSEWFDEASRIPDNVDPRTVAAVRQATFDLEPQASYTLLVIASASGEDAVVFSLLRDVEGDSNATALLWFAAILSLVVVLFELLDACKPNLPLFVRHALGLDDDEAPAAGDANALNHSNNNNNTSQRNLQTPDDVETNEQQQRLLDSEADSSAADQKQLVAASEEGEEAKQQQQQADDDDDGNHESITIGLSNAVTGAVGAGSPQQQQQQQQQPAKKKKERLRSLDAFRGFALCIMIFVNYGGGGYWYLDHSAWDGLTVADLVFAWFIFMMGASMAMSFKTPFHTLSVAQQHDKLWRVLERSLHLFALGVFLNNGYDLTQWRIPGVLQRFGVSYLVNALILMYVPKHTPSSSSMFRDILPYVWEYCVVVVIAALWFVLTFCDIGFGEKCSGYIGPGGTLGDYGTHEGCTGGNAGALDKWLLGEHHLYGHPTPDDVYHTGTYDPEGLLGTLNSVVMVYLGVVCGRIAVVYSSHQERVHRWLVWAVLLVLVALLLCGFSQFGGIVPVNKNLWSTSYILMLAGMAFFNLAIFYILIDVKQWWSGLPLLPMGMNSIVVYCGSEVFQFYFPFSFDWTFRSDDGTPEGSSHGVILLSNAIGVSCWLWIAHRMYKRKTFYNL